MRKKMMFAPLFVAAALLTVGCGTDQPTADTKPPANNSGSGTQTPQPIQQTPDVAPQDQVEVTVYRSNADASAVVSEKATISKINDDSKRALVLFDLLKKEDKTGKSVPSVPANVSVLGVKISGELMTINFDKGVTQLQGSATETMFIESVNKTMFENFKSVNKIKYQIDGKDAEVLTQMSIGEGFNRE